MKYAFLLFFACTSALSAVLVGDTYDAVVAEKGAPKGKMGSSARMLLSYADVSIELRGGKVTAITPVAASPSPAPTSLPAASSAAPKPAGKDLAAIKAEQLKAINRVKAIVNQPVEKIPRTAAMKTQHYPYWFHEGASVPDFNHVDIRQSQKLDYANYPYVYSDLDPQTVFLGKEIEFNANTKFFYTDRSVPKKRLTEPEMLEINRLYRTIGLCDAQISALTAKPGSE